MYVSCAGAACCSLCLIVKYLCLEYHVCSCSSVSQRACEVLVFYRSSVQCHVVCHVLISLFYLSQVSSQTRLYKRNTTNKAHTPYLRRAAESIQYCASAAALPSTSDSPSLSCHPRQRHIGGIGLETKDLLFLIPLLAHSPH